MSKHPASVTGQINHKQTGTFIKQTTSIIQRIKDFDSQAKEISPFPPLFQHSILQVDRETQERTPVLYGGARNSESELSNQSSQPLIFEGRKKKLCL